MNVYSAVCNVDALIRYGPLNCVYVYRQTTTSLCERGRVFLYYCVPFERPDAWCLHFIPEVAFLFISLTVVDFV